MIEPSTATGDEAAQDVPPSPKADDAYQAPTAVEEASPPERIVLGPARRPPRERMSRVLGDDRAGDRIFFGLSAGSGVVVVVLVVLVGAFLVAQAVPAISHDRSGFLTSSDWTTTDPANLHFGVLRLLWVTVASSLVALALAVPLSVGVAVFLTYYAPGRLALPAQALVDLLAAVPSIVFGLWAVISMRPLWAPVQGALASWIGWIPLFAENGARDGSTIFFGGVILAIMILPIITAVVREVFAQTPLAHREAALALGATRWEVVRTTVLPFGRAGLVSAAMLGLGRALGETMAVMMVISALPNGAAWSWSLFSGGETFAAKIANGAAEFSGGLSTGAYIAAGLVLFVLTFAVNAVARVIVEKHQVSA